MNLVVEDLKGKTCVITGGAGVLGTSMVTCLAQQGVKTAIIDLNIELALQKAKEIASSTGGKVIGLDRHFVDAMWVANRAPVKNL